MMEKLKHMVSQIKDNRSEVIEKLLVFSKTDLMFFWGQEKDLIKQQEKFWAPLLKWAKLELDTKFTTTKGIEVPEQADGSGGRIRFFLENLSDKELAAFYIATLDTKSLLIAAALVKKKIDAETAFKAAFLEEHWQAQVWGSVDEAEARQKEIHDELETVEKFLA